MSKLRPLLIIGICSLILIVACGREAYLKGNRSPDSPTNDLPISNSKSCRLVEHEMGKTEICGKPQKVAALSPHILDSMLALGVQPAAYAEAENLNIQTYDNPASQIPYLGKWVTTKPMGIGDRDSPSLERLSLIQPDLILGEEWNNKDEYSLLTQIAPTLLFSDSKNPDEVQSWQQNINGIAKALDKEAQAEELIAAYNRQIAQAQTALQQVLQVYPRVFLISSNLEATYLESQPESTAGKLLQEIGFEIVRPPGFSDSRATISWEMVPQIETDLIIVMSWSNDSIVNTEPTLREKWANNPLLKSMPIFQQGRVFFVDYYLWGGVTRGPLSDRLILEALPDLLLSSVAE
jgi:iron complex transport system substrate-binding protein